MLELTRKNGVEVSGHRLHAGSHPLNSDFCSKFSAAGTKVLMPTKVGPPTGEVPYYLWFGRAPPPITPIEATETMPLDDTTNPVERYKRDVILELQQAYLQVFRKLQTKGAKSRAAHDKELVVELWSPGDLVYLYSPQESSKTGMRKLYNPWTGPFQILRLVNDTSVVIRAPTPNDPAAVKQVHSSRLRRYYAPFVQAFQKPTSPFAFPQTLLSRRKSKGPLAQSSSCDKLPPLLVETFNQRGRRPLKNTVEQAEVV